MSYKPVIPELVEELLTNVAYRTDSEEGISAVGTPYGIYKSGELVGCVQCNGYLDSGTFVGIVDADHPDNPTLYGFSDGISVSHQELTAYAVGLHLNLRNLSNKESIRFHSQLYMLDARLETAEPHSLSADDTLYVFLNGVPFLRMARGKTQTYWRTTDIEDFHKDTHDITEHHYSMWTPYLVELFKYRQVLGARTGTSDIYLSCVTAIKRLYEKCK